MSTTINAVAFNLIDLSIISTHRNIRTNQPGSDTNYISDLGYDGLTIRLNGFETTLAVYDNVMAEFMSSGEQTLVVRSGWQFKVHSTQVAPEMLQSKPNYYPYSFTLITSTPYRESTSETTRSKTITVNNQEWSADNSSNDITTSGNVKAVPDIQITGGAASSIYSRSTPVSSNDTDTTIYFTTSTSYVLKYTKTYSAVADRAWNLESIGADIRTTSDATTVYGKVTYQAASLNSGAETDVTNGEWSTNLNTYVSNTTTVTDVLCTANENLVIRFYLRGNVAGTYWFKNLDSYVELKRHAVCKTPQIYNDAATTIKCNLCNEIEPDMVIRINSNGTGVLTYTDNFSTAKYIDAYWTNIGLTHDTGNDELDIADNGYLVYKIDCKYPITGIPVLTSTINITAGTPTLQISSDGSTWYDIDIAIVDNVLTEYELNNAVSLQLNGLTLFYFRFDCGGTGTVTCSIKSFQLDANIITIDTENPAINIGAANTFKCDQDINSGLNCTIALIYRDRSWA